MGDSSSSSCGEQAGTFFSLLAMLFSSSLPSMSNSSEDNPPFHPDLLFEVDDFLTFGDEADEYSPAFRHATEQNQLILQVNDCAPPKTSSADDDCSKRKSSSSSSRRSYLRSSSVKVAFKTRSEREVLDDGYKWRKYGKKAVKSSPNPRNYFRCTSDGCDVKKRVERHRDDPSFVITTYDGVHNHQPPFPAATTRTHQAIEAALSLLPA